MTLTMGDTRVMTVVTAALEPPFPDRPNEGSLRINVELSPMASPNFEAGRPGASRSLPGCAALLKAILRQSWGWQAHLFATETLPCVSS